jgi:hypothetical protein
MATSDILGLFMSPEQYQAQQMAQQQANEQTRATNFASLTPLQQANYGVFMGAQQLGRGFAGLLGVQDPQLQRIRQRQEIMQTINPADPESLMAGIQRASQMGDQELALTLADYTRKARGDLALAEQREREKVPEAIQIAEEIRKLTVKRDALPEGLERNSIDAQIKRLQLAQKATGSTETAEYKNAFQLTVSENPTLDTESEVFKQKLSSNYNKLLFKDKADNTAKLESLFERRDAAVREFGVNSYAVQSIDRLIDSIAPLKGTADTKTEAVRTAEAFADVMNPDRNSTEWKDAFKSQLAKKGDTKDVKEIVIADQIVALDKLIREAKDPNAPEVLDAKAKADVLRLQLKRERPNLDTLGLAKGGKYDGQPVFLDENTRKTFVFDTDKTGNQIEVPYTGGLKGLKGGTEVNVGGSVVKVDTSETGKAAGKELGKELITVKDKQSAIDSIRDAISILDQGIYAGSFSAIRKGLAKYGGIGDPDKVARTEEFASYIGDVVVARLKDFGGNDSREELAYLNKIIGGDLEIEPKALKRILERAEAKIQRGIERLRRQAESGEKKESLTTTLAPDEGGAQTPAPKPTMRYNPATKKLERIK